ncbi:thymidylate kinase [uncultured Sphingomonas sp.]|uniref:thymidylate kinase n=1 Tax=uncultured Sphingomonas sp. TaxID=158754 RepID=UPI0035CC0300
MAVLVAIEGADGAGKATAAAAVVDALRGAGRTAEVISFPRYTDTVGGHVLGDFLAGRLPHAMSPRALATLYALDRFESRDLVLATAARCDVVVFDRYIASNMAYQAAKVSAEEAPNLMRWIVALETGQFAMPAPDLSIYLDTPLDVARAQIARKRQRSYTDQTYDAHEADDALQRGVRAAYAALVDGDLLGRWQRVVTGRGGAMRPPAEIAAEIVAAIT